MKRQKILWALLLDTLQGQPACVLKPEKFDHHDRVFEHVFVFP
jgi:hypothetical protein